MSTFHFNGDALLASRIDIARAARALRKHLSGVADELGIPEGARSPLRLDQGQGLDVLCKVLGAQSHHAARQAAKSPDITGWPSDARERLIDDLAVSRGRKFPTHLPDAFDDAWQRGVLDMARRAIEGANPASGQLIAIVGGPGSGKTLLANAMADKWDGTVIDISLRSPSMVADERKRESLLVYDAPASPTRPAASSRSGVMTEWLAARTVIDLVAAQRQLFPHLALVQSGMNRLVDDVVSHPSRAFAMSFPDMGAVQAFMETYRAIPIGRNSTVPNWTMAHVINLDELRYEVMPASSASPTQETAAG